MTSPKHLCHYFPLEEEEGRGKLRLHEDQWHHVIKLYFLFAGIKELWVDVCGRATEVLFSHCAAALISYCQVCLKKRIPFDFISLKS